jgi:hypothetical protein
MLYKAYQGTKNEGNSEKFAACCMYLHWWLTTWSWFPAEALAYGGRAKGENVIGWCELAVGSRDCDSIHRRVDAACVQAQTLCSSLTMEYRYGCIYRSTDYYKYVGLVTSSQAAGTFECVLVALLASLPVGNQLWTTCVSLTTYYCIMYYTYRRRQDVHIAQFARSSPKD